LDHLKGFVLKQITFTQLDDSGKMQRQGDHLANLDWSKFLDRNPTL
jgi:hypothetical protein